MGTEEEDSKWFERFVGGLKTFQREGDSNPHKYILLLSIAAILRHDRHHPNRLTFQEIEPVFRAEFDRMLPNWPAERRNAEYPFYHLQTDGYWHLTVKEGLEKRYKEYQRTRLTKSRLIETVAYASLDEDIFLALQGEDARAILEGKAVKVSQTARSEPYDEPSLFAHERSAIRQIREVTSSNNIGELVSNVQLHDREANGYYECDLILASRTGIYLIELKHWSADIRVSPHDWLIDGYRHRPDPHLVNGYKCKLLKSFYEHTFRTYPNVWVESVVVLTNPEATVQGADSPAEAAETARHNLTFASIEDFLSYLKLMDSTQRHILTEAQTSSIISSLQSQKVPASSLMYSVPGYVTVQYLAQRPECIELVARPADGRSRGLNRFRVFRLPPGTSPDEREVARKRAYNTRDAIQRIGDHPNIHRVWVYPNEDGDIVEGADWSEAGTLQDLLTGRHKPMPANEALSICHGLALGLATAHQAGIIHRAVKPEHVLMMNGVPKLTDFDLSFHLDRKPGETTVIPDASQVKDDGYTAPEVLEGGDIDEGTDLFSLGVIAYQLLTGMKPFAATRKLAAQGGRLNDQRVQVLRNVGLPDGVVDSITSAIVTDRTQRPRDALAMAEAFRREEVRDIDTARQIPNARLEPASKYDLYEIIGFLGEGAEAQIYKARTALQEDVALRLFNREVPRERIFKEVEVAVSIESNNVVRLDGRMGYWNNDRYFVVMELVDGETLRRFIDRGHRPTKESFQTVANGLLNGLRCFQERRDDQGESSPLIHGDVKPDNILITRNWEAKLTDFTVAGAPRIDDFQGTSGYVPPDRILGAQMQFSEDGDLYALGVSLWEWAFGLKPYDNPAVGDVPALPIEGGVRLPEAWRDWLLKSVATEAKDRFCSATEMQEALLLEEKPKLLPVQPVLGSQGLAVKPPVPTPQAPDKEDVLLARQTASHANPFVAYLNSLSSTSAGNENATAEAQFSSQFFDRIRVPNPLASFVLQRLTLDGRNVILTGNAGDGKTTIAAEVYQALTGNPMPVQARVEIPDKRIVIVKDMSELKVAERAQALQEAADNTTRLYLIVSNTGTLLESVKQLKLDGDEPYRRQSDLLDALERDEATPILNNRFLLLNVGRTDSIDIACSVFRKMLDMENWGPCESCGLHAECPIFRNVQLVREHLDLVIRRVDLLYRRLYEYDTRLTMRQMTGHLAYAITGGRDCPHVWNLSHVALLECLPGSFFFNRFFGDDGYGEEPRPEATQLQPVRHIREAEFGIMLDPKFERDTWTSDNTVPPLTRAPLDLFRRIYQDREKATPGSRRQARRLVYFFGAMEGKAEKRYVSTFLRSPMLLEYLEVTNDGPKVPTLLETEWRRKAIMVLQEYFAGVRLPEGSWQTTDRLYVTLNRRSSGASTQVVLASFVTDEFGLFLKPRHQAVNDKFRRLFLRRKEGGAEMPLDLPFLDFVALRYEGEVAFQLSAFYVDRLERFQADLLRTRTSDETDQRSLQLLEIGADRKPRPVRIIFSSGRLEVSK